jgi:hypothetical protein
VKAADFVSAAGRSVAASLTRAGTSRKSLANEARGLWDQLEARLRNHAAGLPPAASDAVRDFARVLAQAAQDAKHGVPHEALIGARAFVAAAGPLRDRLIHELSRAGRTLGEDLTPAAIEAEGRRLDCQRGPFQTSAGGRWREIAGLVCGPLAVVPVRTANKVLYNIGHMTSGLWVLYAVPSQRLARGMAALLMARFDWTRSEAQAQADPDLRPFVRRLQNIADLMALPRGPGSRMVGAR